MPAPWEAVLNGRVGVDVKDGIVCFERLPHQETAEAAVVQKYGEFLDWLKETLTNSREAARQAAQQAAG